MQEKNGSVQSIDRALDILEVLSSVPQGLSLSDLAAATRLHVSTAHRLLASLSHRGYVRKDAGSGKYRLTLRLFEISRSVSAVLDLLPASESFLEDLTSYSQEAVHLVERSGSEVVYLYKFEPFLHPVNISSSVGRHNPMYCTGVGKSILAELSPTEVARIWNDTEIVPFTPKTIVTLEDLHADLAEVRRRGYAIDDEEHDEGVRCIAVAIRNWENEPIGAVSISAPAVRMSNQVMARLAPRLMATAGEISRLLGCVLPDN
jgi:DNA-binding IclR family transcriptional regulator